MYVQTDINYLAGIAPGVDLTVYLFDSLNPTNVGVGAYIENEDFLAYLYAVGNQIKPPLVHAMENYEPEDTIFNVTNPAGIDYAERCDEQFIIMGLRGLTMLITSGGAGVGSFYANLPEFDDIACSKAWPSWPATSPYVTAVGITQLSTTHQDPFCRKSYNANNNVLNTVAGWDMPKVDCDSFAETVCQSNTGGVYTSGGGFSDWYDRKSKAPWQDNAVKKYLALDKEYYPDRYT